MLRFCVICANFIETGMLNQMVYMVTPPYNMDVSTMLCSCYYMYFIP